VVCPPELWIKPFLTKICVSEEVSLLPLTVYS
jgi:hypothetical protein